MDNLASFLSITRSDGFFGGRFGLRLRRFFSKTLPNRFLWTLIIWHFFITPILGILGDYGRNRNQRIIRRDWNHEAEVYFLQGYGIDIPFYATQKTIITHAAFCE